MEIKVKVVSENDVLSPVGGKKVGEAIRNHAGQVPIILNFEDSGSHSALFFNALFSVLTDATGLRVVQDIILENATQLDTDTYGRSRAKVLGR